MVASEETVAGLRAWMGAKIDDGGLAMWDLVEFDRERGSDGQWLIDLGINAACARNPGRRMVTARVRPDTARAFAALCEAGEFSALMLDPISALAVMRYIPVDPPLITDAGAFRRQTKDGAVPMEVVRGVATHGVRWIEVEEEPSAFAVACRWEDGSAPTSTCVYSI
jgi:hypothetical protein